MQSVITSGTGGSGGGAHSISDGCRSGAVHHEGVAVGLEEGDVDGRVRFLRHLRRQLRYPGILFECENRFGMCCDTNAQMQY